MDHSLVGGALVLEPVEGDRVQRATANCSCGYTSGICVSAAAATRVFGDHQESFEAAKVHQERMKLHSGRAE